MPSKALLTTLLVAALWASGPAVGGLPITGEPARPTDDLPRIYVMRFGDDLYWTQFVTTPQAAPSVRYVLYGILSGPEGANLTRIASFPYGTSQTRVPGGYDAYAMQVEWGTGSSPLYSPCLMVYVQPPNVSNECVDVTSLARRTVHYDLP